MPTTCNICGAARADDCERALVPCNVRRFREERFAVWRCAECRSIHAEDEVDLDRYYQAYPVHVAELDWKLNVVYGGMLARLRHAGLSKDHRILDYGAGEGLLVSYLHGRGYESAVGYDPYGSTHTDPTVLEQRYDCIVCQDVIEHVADPLELLRQFTGMIEPGGIVSIGTPDAEALDLSDPEEYKHALHLPYHRHILAHSALVKAGEALGWSVDRYYDTMYNNTLFPTMNPRFVLHYLRGHDDVFDLVAEPPRPSWKIMLDPATPFFALFGYFFDRHTDIQVVFRAPASEAA